MKRKLSFKKVIALMMGVLMSLTTAFGSVAHATEAESSDPDKYVVSISDQVKHATVLLNDSKEKKITVESGSEVRIEVNVDSGYQLDEVFTENANGTKTVLQEEDGYYYKVVESDLIVNVTVSGQQKEQTELDVDNRQDDTGEENDDNTVALQTARASGTTQITSKKGYREAAYGIGVGQFTVKGIDGKSYSAFCACHELKLPAVGMTMRTNVCTNENIRKILYYGYGGPRSRGYSYTETSLAISVANGHMDADDTGESNTAYGKRMLNAVKNLPSPGQEFTVYYAYSTDTASQDLVYYSYNPKGKLSLLKESSMPEITVGNSCYSLEGAQYGVYSDENCTKEVATLTTDVTGKSNEIELNAGNYWLKEKQASPGYQLDDKAYKVTVSSGKTVVKNVKEEPGNDPAMIEIEKIDKETGSLFTQGAASLSGAEFTITYYGKQYTEEEIADGTADAEVESGDIVKRTWVLTTKAITNSAGEKKYVAALVDAYKVSGDDFYFYDGHETLPLGTITVEETKAPAGYTLNGAYLISTQEGAEKVEGKYVAQITEEESGKLFKLKGGNEYKVADQVVRGDISFTKCDAETSEKMANIPFKITSNTTGESHTVMTDENGYYSSKSDFVKHSQDTNGGKATSGTWFGQNEDGECVAVNDEVGAFPYDTYTIEELKCDANKHKALYKDTFTVSRADYTVDLGTITNVDLTLSTTAKDEATNSHYAVAEKDTTIIDTVQYSGLKKNKEYVITGTLMDKSTGEPLLDKDGNKITGTTKFKPATDKGSVEVEITFDASDLAGKTVVVFEKVTLDGEEVVAHEDINDEGQTIYFPAIKTTAVDSKTKDHITGAKQEISIVDTVYYENLKPGKEYTVKGTLMDKETGKVVKDADGNKVTAETKFTATDKTGSVDVTFVFDASKLAGKTVVAFEDLYYKNNLYATHADIEDEAQTVVIPKIGTTAKNGENGSQTIYADTEKTIIDIVKYENLIPGKTYTIKGVLMDKATGEELVINGKKVTAETQFTAEDKNGTVDLTFTFDASDLAGKTIVVFEKMYYDDTKIASHTDIEDDGQTVYFPEIKTKAVDQGSGTQNAIGSENTIIVDTVNYKNLLPGAEYIVKGTLMNPVTGEEILDADGNAVSSEVTFTPEKPSGSVEVTFEFGSTGYKNQTVVVFEELYVEKEMVASHTDLDDKDQSIYFPEIKTTATDKADGDKNLSLASEVTIVDEVKYENLVPGETYKVSGVVMDKETGKPLLINDKEVTAEAEFTPKRTAGKIKVEFTFDASGLAEKELVVFEKLYNVNGKLIANHEDLEDEGQTVKVDKKGTITTNTPGTGRNGGGVRTGDVARIGLYLVAMAVAITACVSVVRRRKTMGVNNGESENEEK